ncbi:hypothetical protein [Pedobacter metabolipauper]|uniref:Uncharacterized protein n=1 Tax=Pedobacter metabolipauper TaxID=425513 RepID=A0A4R6SYB0_9SPHI|nr:hypothetical protein [Pedobacter metabolipauper]TDQ11037.1 hypothetical protein ATK78_0151 [Pedobacter metabolipauper]
MSNQLKPLTTLPFITCLLLLMVNDFYLKGAFHNTLTGKLSDFCGLFIFPIFWSALLPKRKLLIFFLTGLLFTYWKSDCATTFIDFFSAHFWPVQRIVDPTDLVAMVILPLAWYSVNRRITAIDFTPYLKFIHPYVISIVVLFAFCATSMPRYVQTFDQPQYVLFNSKALLDSNDYEGEYTIHRFDSLTVVEVNQITTTKRPVKSDDYNKNLFLTEIDKDIPIQMPAIQGEMPFDKITFLTLRTPGYQDLLRFKGARLDGKFIRKSGNHLLITGFYKNGIEDSVWTYLDTASTTVIKKTFVNGERTQIQKFDTDKLISSNRINTRADTITLKYIQLGVLTALAVLMIVLIIRNYRAAYPEVLKIKLVWKYLLCFILPFFVWLMHIGIAVFITDHYTETFDFIFNIFLIYIVTLPLFIIIVAWIKLRKQIDLLWYCLLFGLLYNVFLEYQMLIMLLPDV